MQREIHDAHEKNSHTAAYVAAGLAGVALAGAAFYLSKGRASEALPEIEAEFGLSPDFTAGLEDVRRLADQVHTPSALTRASELLQSDKAAPRIFPEGRLNWGKETLPPFGGTMAHEFVLDPSIMRSGFQDQPIGHTAAGRLAQATRELQEEVHDPALLALNTDTEPMAARFPLNIVGDGFEKEPFDIDKFFRMCEEAGPGITKFDFSGGVPQVTEHIPFGRPIAPRVLLDPMKDARIATNTVNSWGYEFLKGDHMPPAND